MITFMCCDDWTLYNVVVCLLSDKYNKKYISNLWNQCNYTIFNILIEFLYEKKCDHIVKSLWRLKR